jgi:hypothetical protein
VGFVRLDSPRLAGRTLRPLLSGSRGSYGAMWVRSGSADMRSLATAASISKGEAPIGSALLLLAAP